MEVVNSAKTGQVLESPEHDQIVLGDFDGDGDLDAFDVAFGEPDRVWTNDGNGGFSEGQDLSILGFGRDAQVGDLDGRR